MSRFTLPPSIDDIEAVAAEAYRTIPEALRQFATDVVIRVQDFPDEETMEAMELESPFDILGLYHGLPFGEKSGFAAPTQVDMIFLYRRPLLDYWCESGEDLTHLVRHVLIHEIGHHFGLSDEDMEAIEEQP